MARNGVHEAEIRAAVVRFYKDCFGRGPLRVRVAVTDDAVQCLLAGVMTAAEVGLLSGPDPTAARDLVKRWHREVVEANRARLEDALAGLLPAPVQALHHDLSTTTDEALILLRLAAPAGPGG
jgi:uncharacterized protein YbcI